MDHSELRHRLYPDLLAHMSKDAVGFLVHHPLLVTHICEPDHIESANKIYDMKQARIREHRAQKKWSSFILMHERPYRLMALHDIASDITDDAAYWSLVGRYWIDSENIWEDLPTWHEMWTSTRPERDRVMSDEDKAVLRDLPDTVTIWRGVTRRKAADGMSWTIDRSKAVWFANRFAELEGRERILVQGTIEKGNILAYLDSRGESEIVVDPANVRIDKIQRLKAPRKSSPDGDGGVFRF
jgi:hypothetical protein